MKTNALFLTLSLLCLCAASLRAGPTVETAAIASAFESAPSGPLASDPLLTAYGSMDAATRDNLLQRSAGVMEERGLDAATLAASQGASRDLLLQMILGDVAAQVRAAGSSLYQTEGIGGQILGDAEKDPRKLRERLAQVRGLYALVGSKKVAAFLDELDAKAAREIAERDAEKARIAAKRSAEALLKDFNPGFERELMASQDPALAQMKGLLAELHSDRANAYRRSGLVADIQDAAVRSGNSEVQALALQGIVADAYLRPGGGGLSAGATPQALDAAEKIAAASQSPRVEGLTIALMKRQAVRKPDYESAVSAAIDRLTDKGAKLAQIRVPEARVSGLFGAAPTPKLGLAAQLKIGVKEHPVAASLYGLISAGAAGMLAFAGLPLLASLAVLIPLTYIGLKGLWRHHTTTMFAYIPSVVNAFLIPLSFGLSPVSFLVTAATVYAQLLLARSFYKQDRVLTGIWVTLGTAEAGHLLLSGLRLLGL